MSLIKRFLYIILFFSILVNIFAGSKPRIAVLPFVSELSNLSNYELKNLTECFESELIDTNKVILIERNRISEILKEQKITLSGLTRADQVEIGNLSSAEQLAMGEVFLVDGLYLIRIKIVDVYTGEILKSRKGTAATIQGLEYQLMDLAVQLTQDTGKLTIETNTNGQLYVDNICKEIIVKAQEPFLINLPVGYHTLSLDYGGIRETRRITIRKDGNHSISFTDRYYGYINAQTTTPGRLFIDGVFISEITANSPVLHKVVSGNQKVEIHYPSGHKEVKEVKVSINQTRSILFTWVKPPPVVSPQLIKVSPGNFTMGTLDRPNRPLRSVTLTETYFISKYEISYKEVVDVFNWALSKNKVIISSGYVKNREGSVKNLLDLNGLSSVISFNTNKLIVKSNFDNFPCTEISWYGAIAFTNFLNQQHGKPAVYNMDSWTWNKNIKGYRLPTEAEWEYAAAGGNFGKGYLYSGSNSSENIAWFRNNSDGKVHSVGSKQSNELGLYDMSGNLSEWVWDWYSTSYSRSMAYRDPTGPLDGDSRVRKGGSWNNSARSIEITARSYSNPDISNRYVGFRIVKNE